MSNVRKNLVFLKKVPISDKKVKVLPIVKQGSLQIYIPVIKQVEAEYRHEVIEYINGESQKIVIVNRKNVRTSQCRTTATYSVNNSVITEKTSDNVVEVIGQENYNTLLGALSKISTQIKVEIILSLLTEKKQTEAVDSSTQTYQSCIMECPSTVKKHRPRTRITAYVVPDKEINSNLENQLTHASNRPKKALIDVSENSNVTHKNNGENMLPQSTCFMPNLDEFESKKLLTTIDECIDNTFSPSTITLPNGKTIEIPYKPVDKFHIAIPRILKNVTREEKLLLIGYQSIIDWVFSIKTDENDYLPIHLAVLNNDLEFLNRQCLILKSRNETVDYTTQNNLTALQISIHEKASPDCTRMLLNHGADPFLTDNDYRNAFHLAAEDSNGHLRELISYCEKNSRTILEEDDQQILGFEKKSEEELKQYFFNHISTICDEQGYTPLMLACKVGNYENVKLLTDMARSTINKQMTNSGKTALYIAIESACLDAISRSNKSNISEKFIKTIEILLDNGADETIENFSGGTITSMLAEQNISTLFKTSSKMGNVSKYNENFGSVIYVKDSEGNIEMQDLNSVKVKKECNETDIYDGSNKIKNKNTNTQCHIKHVNTNIQHNTKSINNNKQIKSGENTHYTHNNYRSNVNSNVNLNKIVMSESDIKFKVNIVDTRSKDSLEKRFILLQDKNSMSTINIFDAHNEVNNSKMDIKNDLKLQTREKIIRSKAIVPNFIKGGNIKDGKFQMNTDTCNKTDISEMDSAKIYMPIKRKLNTNIKKSEPKKTRQNNKN